jgi:transcriptional regulator with XRE-family HTH domain
LTDDLASRFGMRLREIRKRNGFSQEQLAAEAGLARNFISMVETGERNVTLATVEKLAIALKCRMANLMPDADDE